MMSVRSGSSSDSLNFQAGKIKIHSAHQSILSKGGDNFGLEAVQEESTQIETM